MAKNKVTVRQRKSAVKRYLKNIHFPSMLNCYVQRKSRKNLIYLKYREGEVQYGRIIDSEGCPEPELPDDVKPMEESLAVSIGEDNWMSLLDQTREAIFKSVAKYADLFDGIPGNIRKLLPGDKRQNIETAEKIRCLGEIKANNVDVRFYLKPTEENAVIRFAASECGVAVAYDTVTQRLSVDDVSASFEAVLEMAWSCNEIVETVNRRLSGIDANEEIKSKIYPKSAEWSNKQCCSLTWGIKVYDIDEIVFTVNKDSLEQDIQKAGEILPVLKQISLAVEDVKQRTAQLEAAVRSSGGTITIKPVWNEEKIFWISFVMDPLYGEQLSYQIDFADGVLKMEIETIEKECREKLASDLKRAWDCAKGSLVARSAVENIKANTKFGTGLTQIQLEAVLRGLSTGAQFKHDENAGKFALLMDSCGSFSVGAVIRELVEFGVFREKRMMGQYKQWYCRLVLETKKWDRIQRPEGMDGHYGNYADVDWLNAVQTEEFGEMDPDKLKLLDHPAVYCVDRENFIRYFSTAPEQVKTYIKVTAKMPVNRDQNPEDALKKKICKELANTL